MPHPTSPPAPERPPAASPPPLAPLAVASEALTTDGANQALTTEGTNEAANEAVNQAAFWSILITMILVATLLLLVVVVLVTCFMRWRTTGPGGQAYAANINVQAFFDERFFTEGATS